MAKFLPADELEIKNKWCSYDGTQKFYLVEDRVLICCECGAAFKENYGYGFYTENPPDGDFSRPFLYCINTGEKI